jgi:hypothetical protein
VARGPRHFLTRARHPFTESVDTDPFHDIRDPIAVPGGHDRAHIQQSTEESS